MQTTFALFYGNRGTFPESLFALARTELESRLKSFGYGTISLPAEATRYGAVETLEEAGHREVITSGAKELLKLPEFRDADKAHELMSFLTDSKENLPMPEDGPMKILIGPENVSDALKSTSVVVASYDIGDDMRGLIGVVGPTRMDYATVAARLSGFADGLTRLFGKHELPPKEDSNQ